MDEIRKVYVAMVYWGEENVDCYFTLKLLNFHLQYHKH
jgi:hypothetical protein